MLTSKLSNSLFLCSLNFIKIVSWTYHLRNSISHSVGWSVGLSVTLYFLGIFRQTREYNLHHCSFPPTPIWYCRVYGINVFLLLLLPLLLLLLLLLLILLLLPLLPFPCSKVNLARFPSQKSMTMKPLHVFTILAQSSSLRSVPLYLCHPVPLSIHLSVN